MVLLRNKNSEEFFCFHFSVSGQKIGEQLKFFCKQGSMESQGTPKPTGCATDWHVQAGCSYPPALKDGVGTGWCRKAQKAVVLTLIIRMEMKELFLILSPE